MKKPCRNACKECPYTVKNDHNEKFIERISKLKDNGIIKEKIHKCHMIGTGWDEPTEENVCIGSLENLEK